MTGSPTPNSCALPLAGLRVIDFSRVLAGPLVGQTLGDLGADVIKVERPGHGDDTRTWGPPWHEADDGYQEATYYLSLNRNKRSIVLDLKSADDVAFAQRLAAGGAVILDNFKPGLMEKLGLDRATLAVHRPGVVTCSITAYGADSAAAQLPGYDLVAQATSGLMHLTGESNGRPLRVGVPVVDMMTGLTATVGVLAALTECASTGVGRHVEVSLYDTALSALLNHQTAALMGKADPSRSGNRHPSIAPYESYSAADGDLIIAAANDKLFAATCRALDRLDLLDDPRYATNTSRRTHVDDLNQELLTTLATGSRDHWIAALRAEDVPCGPINSLAEAIAWGESLAVHPIATGGDGFRTVRSPLRFDGALFSETIRPPRLGEHTEEIRAEVDIHTDPTVHPPGAPHKP